MFILLIEIFDYIFASSLLNLSELADAKIQ